MSETLGNAFVVTRGEAKPLRAVGAVNQRDWTMERFPTNPLPEMTPCDLNLLLFCVSQTTRDKADPREMSRAGVAPGKKLALLLLHLVRSLERRGSTIPV